MANKKDGFTFDINKLKDIDSQLSGKLTASEMLTKEMKKIMSPTINDYIRQHESSMDEILGYNAISTMNNIQNLTGSIALDMPELINSFGTSSFQSITKSTIEEYERHSNLVSTHPANALNDYYQNLISNTFGSIATDEFSSINEQVRQLNNSSTISSLETELNLSEHYQHLFSNLFETPPLNQVQSLNNSLKQAQLMIDPYHDIHDSVTSIVEKNISNEAEQLLKSIEKAYTPTALELINEKMASIGNIFNETIIDTAMRESKKLQKFFDNSLTSFEPMKNVALDSLLNNSILDVAGIKSSQLQEILDIGSMSGVYGLEEAMKLATSNAFNIAASYYAEYSDDTYTDEDALSEFEELIKKPKTNLTSENYIFFYISTILSLLMFLYSIHSSKQSDKEHQASINALETTIISQFMILNKNTIEINKKLKKQAINIKPTEYVVNRAVNLRTKNNTTKESMIITTLYPNQKVELLKREGKWIYVCYFDHIEKIPKTGWIYKKYLRIIK